MTSPDKDLATTSRDPISSRSPSHRSPKTKNSPSDSHAKSASVYGIPLSATSTILFPKNNICKIEESTSSNPRKSTDLYPRRSILPNKIFYRIGFGALSMALAPGVITTLTQLRFLNDSLIMNLDEDFKSKIPHFEDIVLSMRMASAALILLAVVLATFMFFKLLRNDLTAAKWRTYILVLTMMGVAVGIPVNSAGFVFLALVGCFYIYNSAGLVPSDKHHSSGTIDGMVLVGSVSEGQTSSRRSMSAKASAKGVDAVITVDEK